MNKMLFCDCLDKLTLFFLHTTPGSHEYPDYHAVHYCSQTAQFFCKNELLRFLLGGAGSVTQSGTGSVTYLTDDSLSYHL